jgi:sulfatase maturation enzyme AslB (radical SAM superfamily)
MQGRNRDRVLNQVAPVSIRLQTVEAVRQRDDCLDVLAAHFRGRISTASAAHQLGRRLNEDRERSRCSPVTEGTLESLVHRNHLEFHPCDRCNLRCSGCTYLQDTASRPAPVSFPFDGIARMCAAMRPKAITIVGGGEPLLYRSGGHWLGDLICAFGNGDFGCLPAIGLITNGTLWPPGDRRWHEHVQWIRYSLDASTAASYRSSKGRDCFERVVGNVLRTLEETAIPQVGVGYLYHPGNVAEAGAAISLFADRIRKRCPDQLGRFNIQFRPRRAPTGRPSIKERILSEGEAEQAAAYLIDLIEEDSFMREFVRQHTNVAVNLLCGGAREQVRPFSDCLFGLAKTVIRADGSLYPCFRVAAARDPSFYCGNVLTDTPLTIALSELYVAAVSTRQICVPAHEQCLFCVFNNLLEDGLRGDAQPKPELAGEYFF